MEHVSTIRERIVKMYGEKLLRKSALNIRGGAGVFEKVLSGKGYSVALEIGTYRGCASAEMAQYVDQVKTIDLMEGKLEQGGEHWNRYEFWKSLGLTNITSLLVKDDDEKRRLIDCISFDIAFVDGAHDYAGVARDFEMVRKCGRVLFHDADDNGPGRPNAVYEFIKTLPSDQVEFMDIFALWRKPSG